MKPSTFDQQTIWDWARFEASAILLPGGSPGTLFQIKGRSAPVGFSEACKTCGRWRLDVERPCLEPPPGAEEAKELQRRVFYSTYDRPSAEQARRWAETAIALEGGGDPQTDWSVGRKGAFKAKSADGATYLLSPASGWPTGAGESVTGEVKEAQWLAWFQGWHLDQKPSCKEAGPVYTKRLYVTAKDLSQAEAEQWARRTAESEVRLLTEDPFPGEPKE